MTEDEIAALRRTMVEEQLVTRHICDPQVLNVMGSVPRHCFVSADDLEWAYSDRPLPIGHGQTISQPYIVALMTELLAIKPGDRLLEVGTGSGYQAAVLGKLAAHVDTVDVIPELAHGAQKTLAELGYTNVNVHTGDGSSGWPEQAPYDGILVAAAAPAAPKPLLDQLADGGRLVIPVGGRGLQQLEVWVRSGLEYRRQVNLEVAFVPLLGEFGWK